MSIYEHIDEEKTKAISVQVSDTLLGLDPNPGEALVGLARVAALVVAYHLPEENWNDAAEAFGELVVSYLKEPFMKEFAAHHKESEEGPPEHGE